MVASDSSGYRRIGTRLATQATPAGIEEAAVGCDAGQVGCPLNECPGQRRHDRSKKYWNIIITAG